MDPLEAARQLSLMLGKKYSLITTDELLFAHGNYPKTGGNNYRRFTDFTQKLLRKFEIEVNRAAAKSEAISYVLRLAHHCFELHNYHFAYELVTKVPSLMKPVSLPARAVQMKEFLLANVRKWEKNFREFRGCMASAVPPCLPVVGLYVKNLARLAKDHSDYITKSNNKLINFDKWRRIGAILNELPTNSTFNFAVVPDIRDLFLKTDLDRLRTLSLSDESGDTSSSREHSTESKSDSFKINLMTSILEDPEFVGKLREALFGEFFKEVKEMARQLKNYTELEQNETQLVNALQTRFPRGSVQVWTYDDKEGIVYGYQDTLKAHVVTAAAGTFVVVHAASCDKAVTAAACRIRDLFQKHKGLPKAKAMVACYHVQNRADCQQRDVALLII
eukprot:TRINITY_DN2737_c0_g1_i2.p1 TRINITY_DN2737_c0_g1~~TRINITY_DN2737_c0_g1_i2.p1  ORF type:complete len:390 (-),score=42.83 TRINITY_DN2737_c0_g1_i2:152-1321(-)